jgi:hypothetical protein
VPARPSVRAPKSRRLGGEPLAMSPYQSSIVLLSVAIGRRRPIAQSRAQRRGGEDPSRIFAICNMSTSHTAVDCDAVLVCCFIQESNFKFVISHDCMSR